MPTGQNWINFIALAAGLLGGSLLDLSLLSLIEVIELFIRLFIILFYYFKFNILNVY